jgi:hypothetical protein
MKNKLKAKDWRCDLSVLRFIVITARNKSKTGKEKKNS